MQRLALVLGILFLASVLTACGGSGDGGSPGGPNFKIYVTDAPFPASLVESASVVIEEVRVREKDAGWQTVFTGSETIDLVPLTGGVATLLVAVDLEPGVYEEVRLIVAAGEVVLKPEAVVKGDSHTFNTDNGGLHHPSAAQTGIKVKIDNAITVVSELTSQLTLDFSLDRNFVFNGPMTHAPGVSRVIFTPVVRAVNSSTAGRLELEVFSDNATPGDTADDEPIHLAQVRALDDVGDVVGSGMTDEQGFMSLELPDGTYDIVVEFDGHETMTAEDVVIAAANLTDLGPIVLAATGGEVTGTVFNDGTLTGDDSDDVVLAGATVTATIQGGANPPVVTTTDLQGSFRFEALPPGTYDLAVTAPGCVDGAIANVVPTLGGTGASIVLRALTRNLTGTVTDGAAVPLAGVTITVSNAAGVVVASAVTTDATGQYAVALGTGAYSVRFQAAAPSTDENTLPVTITGTDPISDQTLDATVPAAP